MEKEDETQIQRNFLNRLIKELFWVAYDRNMFPDKAEDNLLNSLSGRCLSCHSLLYIIIKHAGSQGLYKGKSSLK